MEEKLKDLSKHIKEAVPKVAHRWNTVKLSQFPEFFESTFYEFFKDTDGSQYTQSITKIVSPVLNKMLIQELNKRTNHFIEYEKNGCDYRYHDIDIEGKITSSDDKVSWTGNGYEKTPIHLLLRFNFKECGTIDNIFSMIADLGKTNAKWSIPTESNFSTLKFFIEDEDKLIFCNGKGIRKRKYLHWEMEPLGKSKSLFENIQ